MGLVQESTFTRSLGRGLPMGSEQQPRTDDTGNLKSGGKPHKAVRPSIAKETERTTDEKPATHDQDKVERVLDTPPVATIQEQHQDHADAALKPAGDGANRVEAGRIEEGEAKIGGTTFGPQQKAEP